MARPKGQPKLGGRTKGTPNKINADLRQMILNSLEKAGGEQYLYDQSVDNPVAFLTLVSKVLPKEIKADINVKTAPGMLMVLK